MTDHYTTNLKDRESLHKLERRAPTERWSGADHTCSSGSSHWLAALPPYAALRSRLSWFSILRDGSIAWDRIACWAAALIVALYLASISGSWWPTPDSALYLMLSDNLLAGKGYTLWGQPHIHVPPGFPLFLVGMKWLGLGSVWCLNASMILMALATIWLCYKVLLEQTSRELALVVVAALAFGRAMHFAGVRVLSDMPYMLLVWAGIFCYLRGLARGGAWLEAGTVALLASCAVRVAGVPLAIAAAIGLVLQADPLRRRRALINASALLTLVMAAAGAALAYYWWRFASDNQSLPSYGDSISVVLHRSLWVWIREPIHDFLQTSGFLLELLQGQRHEALGLFTALVWIPVLLGMVLHAQRRHWLAICVVAGYCGPILLQRHMIVRYLLPVAPLLILYFCDGIAWFVSRLNRYRQRGPQVAVICASLLVASHLPRAVGFVFCMHFPQYSRIAAERKCLYETCEYLRRAAKPRERFISSDAARVFAYLGRVPSMPLRSNKLKTYRKADFDRWVRHGVVFAVIGRHELNRAMKRLVKKFAAREGFEIAYQNQYYSIYRATPFEQPLGMRLPTRRVVKAGSRKTHQTLSPHQTATRRTGTLE